MDWDTSKSTNTKNKGWKIATWNVRGLWKEEELLLLQEIENAEVKILGITETKKKKSARQM